MAHTDVALGGSLRLKVAFTLSGVFTDPNTVTLSVIDSANVQTDYTISTGITRESAGNYYADIVFDKSGNWYYKWTGEGAVNAATLDQQISVRTSKLT